MKHKQTLSRRARSYTYTWAIPETQGSWTGHQQIWERRCTSMANCWGIAYRKMVHVHMYDITLRLVRYRYLGRSHRLPDVCATSEDQCQCPSYNFPSCSRCRHLGDAVTPIGAPATNAPQMAMRQPKSDVHHRWAAPDLLPGPRFPFTTVIEYDSRLKDIDICSIL